MAKFFCLTKQLADNLKAAAVRGEINVSEMYNMTSEQRASLFEKWVDKKTAGSINAGFEEAMVSDQKSALKKWAEKTFTGGEKARAIRKDVFDKIDRLNELGVLNPKNADNFLSDLVATDLGVKVTAAEASTIAEKTRNLEELYKTESEFGTPTIEYFKARQDIENYLKSLNPSSRLKVATSVIGRGSMLFSLKSPLLNIESNTVQAFLTAAERRLRGFQVTKTGNQIKLSSNLSGVNGDYAVKYMKYVNKVYQESGYDITRMFDLKSDTLIRGENITTSEGAGKTRKIGRFYEDVVFKQLMGAPDVAFSSFHFADSANLFSTKLARSEGLKGDALKARATELFKDSTRIDPKTKEGKVIRDQAIADAQYATYTNNTWATELSMKIRSALNDISGDVRMGDQLMPFVKTPANVIKVGLDYSGVGIPVDIIYKTAKILGDVKAGKNVSESIKTNMTGLGLTFVRGGLGFALASAIASLFEPDDYIGEYPISTKEQELLRLKNATTNSVRIGDKWVSLDYFGALGTPLVGIMSAKKYGKGGASDYIFNYVTGVAKQSIKIPGLDIAKNTYDSIDKAKYNSLGDNVFALEKALVDYARSRTIPAFITDVGKVLDKYERVSEKKSLIEPLQASIPVWRQQLPVKTTVLGEKVETEGLSTLLFGSRVKSVKSNAVVDEISRLGETGNLPSITDYATTSPRFKELKAQIGNEKFAEAQQYLGEQFYKKLDVKLSSYSYKHMTDEKKAAAINEIKLNLLEITLRKYGYKKPKK